MELTLMSALAMSTGSSPDGVGRQLADDQEQPLSTFSLSAEDDEQGAATGTLPADVELAEDDVLAPPPAEDDALAQDVRLQSLPSSSLLMDATSSMATASAWLQAAGVGARISLTEPSCALLSAKPLSEETEADTTLLAVEMQPGDAVLASLATLSAAISQTESVSVERGHMATSTTLGAETSLPQTLLAASVVTPSLNVSVPIPIQSADTVAEDSSATGLTASAVKRPLDVDSSMTDGASLPANWGGSSATPSSTFGLANPAGDERTNNRAGIGALSEGAESTESEAVASPQVSERHLTTLLAVQTAATTTPSRTEWVVTSTLTLDSNSSSWQQQLVDTLEERVQWQSNQQVKQATIRLDPPELGRLELSVRQEGDRLSVQIHTSNQTLREALQESRDQLRQVLIPQYGAGVEVDISYGQGSGAQTSAELWLQEEVVASNGVAAEPSQQQHNQGTVSNYNLLNTLV